MSPSSRRAWIEIIKGGTAALRQQSPSSRRAWIEMTKHQPDWKSSVVALLAEGVDRNGITTTVPSLTCVALLAEGVDRNCNGVPDVIACTIP